MNEKELREENVALWLLLLKTRRVMNKYHERELATYDITPQQAHVIYIVRRSNTPISQADIARLTNREPHTVSTLLARMVKKGYIKREHDAKRKNIVRITITEKGAALEDKIDAGPSINETIGMLNDQEKECLNKVMTRLLSLTARSIEKHSKVDFLID